MSPLTRALLQALANASETTLVIHHGFTRDPVLGCEVDRALIAWLDAQAPDAKGCAQCADLTAERDAARARADAIMAECAAATAEVCEAANRVIAERDEARLTLAAEQGKAEGAPSDGWTYDGSAWSKDYPDGSTAMVTGTRGRRSWMRASWPVLRQPAHFLGRGFEFPSDRAAMIAADKAQA